MKSIAASELEEQSLPQRLKELLSAGTEQAHDQLRNPSFQQKILQSGDLELITEYALATDGLSLPEEYFGRTSPEYLAVENTLHEKETLQPPSTSPLPEQQTFPRLQQNYLDNNLTDQALQWLYNGLHNLKKTSLNQTLNPHELVKLYVGVWHFKRQRKQDRRLPQLNFESVVPYLIGFGRNSLASRKEDYLFLAQGNYSFHQNLHSQPLTQRLRQLPESEKRAFMVSLQQPLKVPFYKVSGEHYGDFWIPENQAKEGLDRTARRVYLKEIVKLVY